MNDDQEERMVRAMERIARSLEGVEDVLVRLHELVEDKLEEE